MNWLLWRQHRVQAAIAAALLAAFALPVLMSGRTLADRLDLCRNASCGDVLRGYQGINTIVNLTLIVPLLIGIFLGATIIGRELESGTVALVWTQSVSRRRWLVSKLSTLFVFTLLVSGADSVLVTWWSNTHNALVESRFVGLQFDIQNLAPVGYALFASALGLAAGILWRRTLPAMATTVGGFVAVRLLVELWARPHYLSPVVKLTGFKGGPNDVPFGALSISNDLSLHGHVVNGPVAVPEGCGRAASRADMDACMQRAGYVLRSVYQPASRYWTFQWIEFGIFAALAVLLVAVAVYVLRRRDA
jgi:hypothetical protein